MRFFRWIAGLFGPRRHHRSGRAASPAGGSASPEYDEQRGGTAPCVSGGGGYAVQDLDPVDGAYPCPIVVPCDSADGEVQGFKWYTRKLQKDKDGDVADEFLEEIHLPPGTRKQCLSPVEYNYQPTAKMTMIKQVIAADGNYHKSLEYK